MKLTTKRRLSRIAGSVRESRSMQTRRIGGSAETLVTAFVVRPRGVPSRSSVVAKCPPDDTAAE